MRHFTFVEPRKDFGVNRCWPTKRKIMILLPDKTRVKVEAMAELWLLIARFLASAAVSVAQAAVSPPQVAGIKISKGPEAATKSRRKLH